MLHEVTWLVPPRFLGASALVPARRASKWPLVDPSCPCARVVAHVSLRAGQRLVEGLELPLVRAVGY